MSDVLTDALKKVLELLVDLVKDHPIWTLLIGAALLLLFANLRKQRPDQETVLIVALILLWPLLTYFFVALTEYLSTEATTTRTQLAILYQIFLHNPRLVLVHIAFWFVIVNVAYAFFLLWASDWGFHKFMETVRESKALTIIVMTVGILLGCVTAKVHTDLLGTASPPAQVQK
jgi:hypothetical protein